MKKTLFIALCAAMCIMATACHEEPGIFEVGAAGIAPAKSELIGNLSDKGYTITEYDDIYGLDVDGERVYAEKGGKYIDICCGLDEAEAEIVFDCFEDKYSNENYYILARNEYFVYCVSDKGTFNKSGFKSEANIGVQYTK